MAVNGPNQPDKNEKANKEIHTFEKEYNGKMYSFNYFIEQGMPVFLNFNPADPFGKAKRQRASQVTRRYRFFG